MQEWAKRALFSPIFSASVGDRKECANAKWTRFPAAEPGDGDRTSRAISGFGSERSRQFHFVSHRDKIRASLEENVKTDERERRCDEGITCGCAREIALVYGASRAGEKFARVDERRSDAAGRP